MSDILSVFALFDDTDVLYPILNQLNKISSSYNIIDKEADKITLKFYDTGNLGDTIKAYTNCKLYKSVSSVNTLIWEGIILKETITVINNILTVNLLNYIVKLREYPITCRAFDRVDGATESDIIDLLRVALVDNSVPINWLYVNPTTTYKNKIVLSEAIKSEVQDVAYLLTSGGYYYSVVLTKTEFIIMAKHEVGVDGEQYSFKRYAIEGEGFRVLRNYNGEAVFGHFGDWYGFAISIKEAKTQGGIVEANEHIPFLIFVQLNITTGEIKARKTIFTSGNMYWNINKIGNDVAIFIMPGSLIWYNSGAITKIHGLGHYIKDTLPQRNDLSYVAFNLAYDTEYGIIMYHDDTLLKIANNTAKFIPASIDGKTLAVDTALGSIVWYEIDLVAETKTVLGYDPGIEPDNIVRCVKYGDVWYIDTRDDAGDKILKIEKIGPTWAVTDETPANSEYTCVSGKGYAYKLTAGGVPYFAGWDASNTSLENYSYIAEYELKNRLFGFECNGNYITWGNDKVFSIVQYYDGTARDNQLFLDDVPTQLLSNIYELLRNYSFILGMIVRYNFTDSKFEFMNFDTETTLHTLDNSYVNIDSIEKHYYDYLYSEDVFITNPVYNICVYNNKISKYNIERDNINGDLRAYAGKIIDYVGAEKYYYKLNYSGILDYKYWDRVEWNTVVYRLQNITVDYASKITELILREI